MMSFLWHSLWVLDSFKAVSSLLLIHVTRFPLHSHTSVFTCFSLLSPFWTMGSSRGRCRLILPACYWDSNGVSPLRDALKESQQEASKSHSPRAPSKSGNNETVPQVISEKPKDWEQPLCQPEEAWSASEEMARCRYPKGELQGKHQRCGMKGPSTMQAHTRGLAVTNRMSQASKISEVPTFLLPSSRPES